MATGEMKHADELIQRILFPDGLPNVQRLNPIQVGEKVEQILKANRRWKKSKRAISAHSKMGRGGTVMVSTINEVDTMDERSSNSLRLEVVSVLRNGRRRYDSVSKQRLVEACRQPGA